MRMTLALSLLMALSYLPLTAATCGTGDPVPVITSVDFPTQILGDNKAVAGKIAFTDADAGVMYAHLSSVMCPSGYVCPSASFDLTTVDPEIINYNAGTIPFSMQCNNPTTQDVTMAYSWALEDVDGNVSVPVDFSFTCVGANKSPVPVITSLTFPSTIPGDGTAVTGSMTFSDGNAGVKYASLSTVVCPTGFSCPSGTIDLTQYNPGIITVFSGTINFTLSCTNTSTVDGAYKVAWKLTDVDGNVSKPWEFAFTCKVKTPARTSEALEMSRFEGSELNLIGMEPQLVSEVRQDERNSNQEIPAGVSVTLPVGDLR